MIQDNRLPLKEKVLDYLSHMPFYRWAAKSIGKDEDTIAIWRKEDPDFSERCETAKSEAIRKLGARATPDFMLKSADPKTFKDRVDVTSGDKPIPIMPIHVPNNDSNQKDKPTD